MSSVLEGDMNTTCVGLVFFHWRESFSACMMFIAFSVGSIEM